MEADLGCPAGAASKIHPEHLAEQEPDQTDDNPRRLRKRTRVTTKPSAEANMCKKPRRSRRAMQQISLQTKKEVVRSSVKRPVLLFTGIECSETEEKNLIKFNARLAKDLSRSVTHIILGEADQIGRTNKLMRALAVPLKRRGAYVVRLEWVEKSAAAGYALSEEAFPPDFSRLEKKHKFSFSDACARRAGASKGLLSGMKFLITPKVIPPAEFLKPIIEAASGTVLRSLSSRTSSKVVHVITCEDDHTTEYRDSLATKNIAGFFGSDLVMRGILTQELDLDAYRLSSPGAISTKRPAQASPTGARKRKKIPRRR